MLSPGNCVSPPPSYPHPPALAPLDVKAREGPDGRLKMVDISKTPPSFAIKGDLQSFLDPLAVDPYAPIVVLYPVAGVLP